jgi:hypothetical protein
MDIHENQQDIALTELFMHPATPNSYLRRVQEERQCRWKRPQLFSRFSGGKGLIKDKYIISLPFQSQLSKWSGQVNLYSVLITTSFCVDHPTIGVCGKVTHAIGNPGCTTCYDIQPRTVPLARKVDITLTDTTTKNSPTEDRQECSPRNDSNHMPGNGSVFGWEHFRSPIKNTCRQRAYTRQNVRCFDLVNRADDFGIANPQRWSLCLSREASHVQTNVLGLTKTYKEIILRKLGNTKRARKGEAFASIYHPDKTIGVIPRHSSNNQPRANASPLQGLSTHLAVPARAAAARLRVTARHIACG